MYKLTYMFSLSIHNFYDSFGINYYGITAVRIQFFFSHCLVIVFLCAMTTMATTNPQLLAASHIASTNLNFQIPSISIKLNRDNYSLWRTTIIFVIECFDLDSFIIHPVPPPATILLPVAENISDGDNGALTNDVDLIPNPEFATWRKRDRYVLPWLKFTLSDHTLATVARSSSSHQA